jgi:hypothetical protein
MVEKLMGVLLVARYEKEKQKVKKLYIYIYGPKN